MLENINNVFKRIKSIQKGSYRLNNYKPEPVKEFEKMYKEALIKSNKKKEYNKTENIHPYLKNNISKKRVESNDKNKMIDEAVSIASKKHKISEDLIRAVITAESNYDQYGVSKKGAMGLMQLMPKTTLKLGIEKPFDIYQNIDGGTRYLKLMLDRYNQDLEKALAAYNAGPTKVDKAGGIPDIKVTKKYIKFIKRLLFK